MSTEIAENSLPAVLQQARTEAVTSHLLYAGGVVPQVAWALFSQGLEQLVDVRTAEERHFVGHVPASLHVSWAMGTALSRSPRFVRELEARLAPHGGKDAIGNLGLAAFAEEETRAAQFLGR